MHFSRSILALGLAAIAFIPLSTTFPTPDPDPLAIPGKGANGHGLQLSAEHTFMGAGVWDPELGKGEHYKGSCDVEYTDNDVVVAIAWNWEYNKYCGRTLTLVNVGNYDRGHLTGNAVEAKVVDRCREAGSWHCKNAKIMSLTTGTVKALNGGEMPEV
ncbi:hypothetical protein G7Y89_g15361 [Cudoniella acicularis]|uniref:Uncharacterized protein n=1 Tax=Cudoniella acicularis TaxID=354080 RepID=A0A8H4QQ56_9HELO|nr:hypothetical protein G7Y89_g15361 [Cudoniella acicularis]